LHYLNENKNELKKKIALVILNEPFSVEERAFNGFGCMIDGGRGTTTEFKLKKEKKRKRECNRSMIDDGRGLSWALRNGSL
jgi:hypothetical protein